DYRDNDHQKTMTLSADEFIRRFLLHVLPDGFQRIRYYGFLSNRDRDEKLALCRQLLGMRPLDPEPAPGDQPADYDYNHVLEQLKSSLGKCPVCHEGRMIVLEVVAPVASAPLIDTSRELLWRYTLINQRTLFDAVPEVCLASAIRGQQVPHTARSMRNVA